MTTIAYRNGRLCADTQTSRGYTTINGMTKLTKGPRGLGAACGSAGFCSTFQEWVAGERDECPEARSDGDNSDAGLLIHPDGRIQLFECGGMFFLDTPYFAMGSGRDQALGAMFAGADARMAVEAAIAHDAYTGGTVMTVELE